VMAILIISDIWWSQFFGPVLPVLSMATFNGT